VDPHAFYETKFHIRRVTIFELESRREKNPSLSIWHYDWLLPSPKVLIHEQLLSSQCHFTATYLPISSTAQPTLKYNGFQIICCNLIPPVFIFLDRFQGWLA
jgi:hypothetical protein